MSDDVDDFFKKIKKFFNFSGDIFDLDVFMFPESNMEGNLDLDDENMKGFKMSYHYEKGMDKPEVKIEGNIDEKTLNEYLKNYNPDKNLRIKEFIQPKGNDEIDASELILEDYGSYNPNEIQEAPLEINDFDNFTEIIIEMPGIEKDDISISFKEEGTIVNIYITKEGKNFIKDIQLPYASSINDTILEINNGIIILKVMRSE